MTSVTDTDKTVASTAALPMRGDVSPEPASAPLPEKDIHKTVGGRITDFFIYYVLGFAVNSVLSLVFTYILNPRPGVKRIKDAIAESVSGNIKSLDHKKTLDSVRSNVEMCFQFISGFLVTGVMTPLASRRDRIAYKINQWLGKDTDVLPDHLKPVALPKTVEERIEQELKKRVNSKHSATDLWKSRVVGMVGCIVGDLITNRSSRILEGMNKPSITTVSWGIGQKLYSMLPRSVPAKINNWFSRHDASLDDMKTNANDHYNRLLKMETKHANGQPINEDRMVVAEQTRILLKEFGWTFFMAGVVDGFTRIFNKNRVARQQAKALAEIKREGLVPEGYTVAVSREGKVKLEADSQWVAKSRSEKSDNYAKSVNSSRAGTEQMALS